MTPQQLMTIRLLWSSLLMSNVILVVVGFFIAGVTDPSTLVLARAIPAGPDVVGIVWGCAFGSLVASFALPRLLLSTSSSKSTRFGADAATSRGTLIQRAQTPFLLSMALAEACTLMGFVAALFMGPQVPELMLLPAGASVLVGLSRNPTEASLRRLVGDT